MYQIICDNYVLHDPRIDELKVINAKCSLEVNKTGSLTFQIHPMHPYYDEIKKHTSQITLLQDGEALFCGRVLNDSTTIDNIKSVECEGILSYLIDSIQRPRSFTLDNGENTIKNCLKSLIGHHNACVDDYKKFKLGNVTVTYDDEDSTTISVDGENTLSFINSKLISSYGGYLIVRNETDGRYIDYISEYTNTCNQVIQFGKNIVDMKSTLKGENIYTAILGVGTKTANKGYTSLTSCDNGTYEGMIKYDDYVYNPEGVAKYGWIWNFRKYDTPNPYTVLKNAIDELKNSINTEVTFELTAIDLHLINVDIDRISIGDMVRCLSNSHNIDMMMLVSAMTIDVDNPANTKVKLILPTQVRTNLGDNLTKKITDKGTNKDTIDDLDQKLADNNEEIKQWVTDKITIGDDGKVSLDDYETKSDVISKIDDVKAWTGDNYVPKSEISDYAKTSDIDTKLNDYAKTADLNNTYASKTDLSAYAKIADVNTAFNELATALGGL